MTYPRKSVNSSKNSLESLLDFIGIGARDRYLLLIAKEVELIVVAAWANREAGYKIKIDNVSAMAGDEIVVI